MLRRLALLCVAMIAPSASAILFYGTDPVDPAHNTTAPTGAYADSGWQYEGYFGSYLGTMIAPQYFITAQHIGVNDNKFVYDSVFSGAPTTTYNVDTSANGGTGYWDISGTDLRIFKITGGIFPTYAPVYGGSGDTTAAFVVAGRGGPRGADVTLFGNLKGFDVTAGDGVARWGRNQFSGAVSSGVGTLLRAEFDGIAGQDEATFSVGDSGGGGFINIGGEWQLAGINYGVELGPYSTSPLGTNPFSAALFDKTGYFEQDNLGVWVPVSGASSFYLSRVSESASQIANITGVPEPSGSLLILAASGALIYRRRR